MIAAHNSDKLQQFEQRDSSETTNHTPSMLTVRDSGREHVTDPYKQNFALA